MLNWAWTFTSAWQKEDKRPPGWLVPPGLNNFYRKQSHTLLIYTDFFSICWGSGFNTASRTFFIQINMGDGGLGKKKKRKKERPYFTSPSMIWDQMTCPWVFSPHTTCSGRFMRLAVVLYRICASVLREKVRWAHAGNTQAFVGIFLFFPGTAFSLLLGSSLLLNHFAFLEN